jgi:hypothetical protein
MENIDISTAHKQIIICACEQIIEEMKGKTYSDSFTLKFTHHYDDW